ncbi:histone acetyltransferase [Veronia nyctiphanis]|uniref:Histone acetyltransferase n=1 Tax=Veronia nyctiphanis TaxID=1278244 RepID=A0A4Q0YAD8_9GAMM|nr:GNAT family N-acetyltransferase [Veronia nyctiphanis]RXJ67202.1 histone acetyltransferase [Veronia nyctiphanis]
MDIDFVFSPSEKEASAIFNGLSEFNKTHFPKLDEASFGCFVRNEFGETLGGMTGKMLFSSLHVHYFWLSEPLRGLGVGSQVIQHVELEAKNRGISNVYLDTYSFQAPKFYEKLGYIEVGRYSDYPKAGIDKIFYQKHIGRN